MHKKAKASRRIYSRFFILLSGAASKPLLRNSWISMGGTMGILTEEMKHVVTELQLCYAATVTPDGKPNLSPKGSITVLSDDELGFADLASPGTIDNLRHNPAIELNVVDPFTRRGFRFKGRAEIVKNPEAHGRIARI